MGGKTSARSVAHPVHHEPAEAVKPRTLVLGLVAALSLPGILPPQLASALPDQMQQPGVTTIANFDSFTSPGRRSARVLAFSGRTRSEITDELEPGETIREITIFSEYTVVITSSSILIFYNQETEETSGSEEHHESSGGRGSRRFAQGTVHADGGASTRVGGEAIGIIPLSTRIRIPDVMADLETYVVSQGSRTIYFLERDGPDCGLFTIFPIDGVDGSDLPRTYSISAEVSSAKIHVHHVKSGDEQVSVLLASGEEVTIPDEDP